MLKNYLKTVLRHLLRNKVYSVTNITGLAVGLACCTAIGLYVLEEYSYDKFHTKGRNIYRVVAAMPTSSGTFQVAVTPEPLAPSLLADFPEITEATRVTTIRETIALGSGKRSIELRTAIMAENSFFEIFDFPLVVGDPLSALDNPDDIVITTETADKLFGAHWTSSRDITSKTIITVDGRNLKIAGVVKTPPPDSHMQFDAIFSIRNDLKPRVNNWNSNNYHTYILVNSATTVKALADKLTNYLAKFSADPGITLSLQPLWDIHLYSNFAFQTDWSKTGSLSSVRIFSTAGVIVLIIALFNFVNLSTARAMKRAHEVGLRKAIGAYRGQLVAQFLAESFLITFIAMLLAAMLLAVALPHLNLVTGQPVTVPPLSFALALQVFLVLIFISILAGLYPAFYLSRFQPLKVLKGSAHHGSGRTFRRTLVIGQFTLSVVLIMGTTVIYQQVQFMHEKNLGFEKAHLLYVRLKGDAREHSSEIKNILLEESAITSVAATSSNLIDVINSTGMITWEGQPDGDKFTMTSVNVDPDFLGTAGIQLVAGRSFDPRMASDTTAFIVNESAARRMNWTPGEALGKNFSLWGRKGKIIGVVRDFHFRALTTLVEPFVFRYWPHENFQGIFVRLSPGQVRHAIAAIETAYKKFEPDTSVDYQFMDAAVDAQYRIQQRTGILVFWFAGLAIFVACLGLFGLSVFTANQRVKEIGIRKVLGANVTGLVGLLSADFLKPVLFALVVGLTVAWYMMTRWLQAFAYRVDLSWWTFIVTGAAVLSIAFLTVAFQSFRAASANPVDSLRPE